MGAPIYSAGLLVTVSLPAVYVVRVRSIECGTSVCFPTIIAIVDQCMVAAISPVVIQVELARKPDVDIKETPNSIDTYCCQKSLQAVKLASA